MKPYQTICQSLSLEMLFSVTVMKSLKSFPVPSPCSDLLSIVNKRILNSAKSTYPFHTGSQCSTWLCVLVLEIVNNDVKPIVIKESCLLNSSCFSFDIIGSVYNDFEFFSLQIRVCMITLEIEPFGGTVLS